VERALSGYADIKYFVGTDFGGQYNEGSADGRSKLQKLERTIERSWVAAMTERCSYEEQVKQSEMFRAKRRGDTERLRHAEKMAMPFCESLQSYYDTRDAQDRDAKKTPPPPRAH
jgi:hypothetical protein